MTRLLYFTQWGTKTCIQCVCVFVMPSGGEGNENGDGRWILYPPHKSTTQCNEQMQKMSLCISYNPNQAIDINVRSGKPCLWKLGASGLVCFGKTRRIQKKACIKPEYALKITNPRAVLVWFEREKVWERYFRPRSYMKRKQNVSNTPFARPKTTTDETSSFLPNEEKRSFNFLWHPKVTSTEKRCHRVGERNDRRLL